MIVKTIDYTLPEDWYILPVREQIGYMGEKDVVRLRIKPYEIYEDAIYTLQMESAGDKWFVNLQQEDGYLYVDVAGNMVGNTGDLVLQLIATFSDESVKKSNLIHQRVGSSIGATEEIAADHLDEVQQILAEAKKVSESAAASAVEAKAAKETVVTSDSIASALGYTPADESEVLAQKESISTTISSIKEWAEAAFAKTAELTDLKTWINNTFEEKPDYKYTYSTIEVDAGSDTDTSPALSLIEGEYYSVQTNRYSGSMRYIDQWTDTVNAPNGLFLCKYDATYGNYIGALNLSDTPFMISNKKIKCNSSYLNMMKVSCFIVSGKFKTE